MKELSIEEKAKRYDEAIKKVNDYYEGKTKLYSNIDKTLDCLFPELKENENEKIRKSLKSLVLNTTKECTTIFGISQKDMLDWLEKQKSVEWSDENKSIIDGIIEYLECFNDYDHGDEPYEEYCGRFEKYIKFMESLKPQLQWKPSEEHIRYLQAVVNDVHNIGSESCCITLRNLLEQLKKL